MAHSQPFSTVIYNSQSLNSSSARGGLAFSTIQWNVAAPSWPNQDRHALPPSDRQTGTADDSYAPREPPSSSSSPPSELERTPEPRRYVFVGPDGEMDAGDLAGESSVRGRRVARRRTARDASEDSVESLSETRYNVGPSTYASDTNSDNCSLPLDSVGTIPLETSA